MKRKTQKRTKINPAILLGLFVVGALYVWAADSNKEKEAVETVETTYKGESFKVITYNVENLFDTKNDSLINDSDFTPEGKLHWTPKRYKKKLADIAKVIIAIGEWETPALVGLCEVENRGVIEDLVHFSPLAELNYSFVHKESPDARGIDVALLYQKDKFRLLREEFISMKTKQFRNFRTRDILYATGVVPTGDTVHVFVNHFPSRLGGELESEPKRMFVASRLRHKVDSICRTTPTPRIIIMGDFNDSPENRSMSQVLQAAEPSDSVAEKTLYNLCYPFHYQGLGTHKYGSEWTMLDHIIVSGTLLQTDKFFYTTVQNAHIFSPDFLRNYGKKGRGFKPSRTFDGQKYLGGVSDHFPVYVEFKINSHEYTNEH